MSLTEDPRINDPDTVPFLTAAREFCRQIENPNWENKDAFIGGINISLMRLYNYGSHLPLVRLTKCYVDTLELDQRNLSTAVENIKRNTPFQYYWTILNPLELEMPSTGTGDL